MKKTIVLLFSVFSLMHAKADYMPLSLPEMILQAECIVYGTIEATDNLNFTLKIDTHVAGIYNENTITVRRFVDFSCAARWTAYAPGQKVFLFLKQNDNNQWIILSDGGEGELPILNNKVYLSSWYGFDMEFKIAYRHDKDGNSYPQYYQTFELYGEMYYGVEFSLDEFTEAIRGLREICTKTNSENFGCKCRELSLGEFSEQSDLNNWLYEKTKDLCK